MRRLINWARNRRGRMALVLAVVSVGLPYGLLALLGKGFHTVGQLAFIAAATVWLLAGAFVAPNRRPTTPTGAVTSLAFVIYALAFVLPAAALSDYRLGEPISGYEAFAVGYWAEALAWLANPWFLVALQCHRLGWFSWSAIAAAIASILALTVPLTSSEAHLVAAAERDLYTGYFAWAAAPVVLFVAAVLGHWRQQTADLAPV